MYRPSYSSHAFGSIMSSYLSEAKMLLASLDLNCSPSPAYNGGTMMSAPGGKRNRFESTIDLQGMIREELERWWEPDTNP